MPLIAHLRIRILHLENLALRDGSLTNVSLSASPFKHAGIWKRDVFPIPSGDGGMYAVSGPEPNFSHSPAYVLALQSAPRPFKVLS